MNIAPAVPEVPELPVIPEVPVVEEAPIIPEVPIIPIDIPQETISNDLNTPFIEVTEKDKEDEVEEVS